MRIENKTGKTAVALALFLIISALLMPFAGITARAANITLGVNKINAAPGEGYSMILTRNHCKNIHNTGNDYTWWKTVTFEYSDKEKAYLVTDKAAVASSAAVKDPYVPKEGFVLAVNLGNDYSATGGIKYTNKIANDAFYAIDKIQIGDRAYLENIDLAKGKIKAQGVHYKDDFVSESKIYIGTKPAGKNIYEPERKENTLPSVKFVGGNSIAAESGKDFRLEWEEVEGAEKYTVNINMNSPSGPSFVSNKETKENFFKTDGGDFKTGIYYVSVYAEAEGKNASFASCAQLFASSKRGLEGPFRDKTVVAFGDSITFLPGWVDALSTELAVKVINAGVSGDKTLEAVRRMEKDVFSHNPDVVLIMFGMNDQAKVIASGNPLIPLADYERNYRKIIKRCFETGAQPVLMTCNPVCTDNGYYKPGMYGLDYGGGFMQKFHDVARRLAKEYDIDLIDINKKCESEKASQICAYGDGIHLSAYGTKMYTKWISDYLFDEFEFKDLSAESADESKENSEPESEGQEISEPIDISKEEIPSEISAITDPMKKDSAKLAVGIILGVIAICAAVVIIIVLRKKGKKE